MLFEDVSKVANGVFSALGGLREQMEARHPANQTGIVSRAEFDAVAAMAAKGRDQQEELTRRIAELEARLSNGNAA